MTLYIANTTKQHWNHHFRVIEMPRPIFVRIESGTQVVLGQGWNQQQTADVIHQLEKFGARDVRDVSGKLEHFPGLFYSTDKAISEDQIVAGHDAVVDAQERRAATEASRSALAFDVANREGKKGRGKRLARISEVTVTQDIPRNEKPTGKEVNLSISVSEDGSSNAKLPV